MPGCRRHRLSVLLVLSLLAGLPAPTLIWGETLWNPPDPAIVHTFEPETYKDEFTVGPDPQSRSFRVPGESGFRTYVIGTRFGDGIAGQCVRFRSMRDAVVVTSTPRLDRATAVTVSAWVRVHSLRVGNAEFEDSYAFLDRKDLLHVLLVIDVGEEIEEKSYLYTQIDPDGALALEWTWLTEALGFDSLCQSPAFFALSQRSSVLCVAGIAEGDPAWRAAVLTRGKISPKVLMDIPNGGPLLNAGVSLSRLVGRSPTSLWLVGQRESGIEWVTLDRGRIRPWFRYGKSPDDWLDDDAQVLISSRGFAYAAVKGSDSNVRGAVPCELLLARSSPGVGAKLTVVPGNRLADQPVRLIESPSGKVFLLSGLHNPKRSPVMELEAWDVTSGRAESRTQLLSRRGAGLLAFDAAFIERGKLRIVFLGQDMWHVTDVPLK